MNWKEDASNFDPFAGVHRTLGFIDQTIYANEGSSEAVTWRNAEVLDLLRTIRSTLLEES